MLKRVKYISVLCVFAFVLIGCDLDGQTAEANKINDETNVLIQEYNAGSNKKVTLYNKLLADNLEGVSDLKAYKKNNAEEFEELTESIKGQIETSKKTEEKYSLILKLDVSDAHKSYVKANLAVNAKRIEADQSMLDIVEQFLETDDIDKVNKLVEAESKEMDELDKELDDLEKDVERIESENPDEFNNG